MIAADILAGLALELFEAEKRRVTLDPLSERHRELSLADAYGVQSEYIRLRQARDGAVLVGTKVGCTSRAMQEYFGIDQPDFGVLLSDMELAEGVALDLSELIQPRIEAEIAFILGADLAGPGIDIGDVMAATAAVAPAIEIIDSRIHEWRIRFEDTVSDNGSSARFVVGRHLRPEDIGDAATVELTFTRNDGAPSSATGAAVLGHPANAVAWLANTLGSLGGGLQAGHVVLSGSLTAAMQCAPGDRFVAAFDRLGSIELSVSA